MSISIFKLNLIPSFSNFKKTFFHRYNYNYLINFLFFDLTIKKIGVVNF